MIQLINGSIFGTKCDLLVVPANNLGGVADSAGGRARVGRERSAAGRRARLARSLAG